MQCLALKQTFMSAPRVARRSRSRGLSRRALVVKAHEEEDILPIWSGRVEVPDPEKLPQGQRLGGKTLGEELVLLHEAYNKDEQDKEKEMEAKLYNSNWQGDVYVGSNWNMLTLITGLMFFVPVLGLLFAYLSYGTLWTGHYYGI
eukprot:GHUV01000696.1.p1 GENE.GHUV01000696.1~~GHUV01000696.1.p1  ORF type:complete len:145 (+),score=27.10 GHUV01000696.1:449-883(+)